MMSWLPVTMSQNSCWSCNCRCLSWGTRQRQDQDNLPSRRTHWATKASSVVMAAPFPQGKSQQVFLTIFLNNIWGGMPGYKINTLYMYTVWLLDMHWERQTLLPWPSQKQLLNPTDSQSDRQLVTTVISVTCYHGLCFMKMVLTSGAHIEKMSMFSQPIVLKCWMAHWVYYSLWGTPSTLENP